MTLSVGWEVEAIVNLSEGQLFTYTRALHVSLTVGRLQLVNAVMKSGLTQKESSQDPFPLLLMA